MQHNSASSIVSPLSAAERFFWKEYYPMSRHNSTVLRNRSGQAPVRRPSTRRHLGRCSGSGKIRFRDKREALAAVHAASTSRRFAESDGLVTARQERRTYLCSSCLGWHLTSQEARDASPADGRSIQSSSNGPIDRAAGPRRVILAIRGTRVVDESAIQPGAAFSDPPPPLGTGPRISAIAPSQCGPNTRSTL